MSTFTEAEPAYMHERRLARVATVGPDGTPHVTTCTTPDPSLPYWVSTATA